MAPKYQSPHSDAFYLKFNANHFAKVNKAPEGTSYENLTEVRHEHNPQFAVATKKQMLAHLRALSFANMSRYYLVPDGNDWRFVPVCLTDHDSRGVPITPAGTVALTACNGRARTGNPWQIIEV